MFQRSALELWCVDTTRSRSLHGEAWAAWLQSAWRFSTSMNLPIPFQIQSKYKRTHPSNREVSFFKGELGGVSEMFFTSSDQKTCQTVHPEATGDLKDWRWICQAAATAIWALCLLSAAGIESTVHARWWLGQMAGVKKTWWCFSSCSRNLVILQKNPSMPLMICT